MVQLLEYILIPAGLLLVLGLEFWSYRRRGTVCDIDACPRTSSFAVVILVVATIAQLLAPVEYKPVAQPLLIVVYLLLLSVVILAGLWQRRGEATASEARA